MCIYIYIHIYIYTYIYIYINKGIYKQLERLLTSSMFSSVQPLGKNRQPKKKAVVVGSSCSGDEIYIYMGVSENSVPLNPLVNDHYPYYMAILGNIPYFQTNTYIKEQSPENCR